MKIVISFLALALASGAFAAESSPPAMFRLYQTDVPPATAAEFYAVQREIAEVYKTNQAPIPRTVWTSLSAEAGSSLASGSRFMMKVPIAGITALTESSWLSQQGTPASRSARDARFRAASGTGTGKIITEVPELIWDPSPGVPEPFGVLWTYSVKVGKAAAFIEYMKQAAEVTKKAGQPKRMSSHRVSFGGDINEFSILVEYTSLADLPTPAAFTAAIGGPANLAAYYQQQGELIHSVHRDIVRFRPEFSHVKAGK